MLDAVQDRHVRHGEEGTESEADEEGDAPHLVLALIEPGFLRRSNG